MKTLPTPKIIQGLPPVLEKSDRCAIDMELFGLNEKKLHRPAGRFGSLACSIDDKTTYILYDEAGVTEFLKNIDAAVWIGHNLAFDLGHLRRWTTLKMHKRIWDTMLMEKILWNGYYSNDQFSLSDVTRRYCDIYLPKGVRKEFSDKDAVWTPEMEVYAANDPIANWLVYKAQKEIVDDSHMKIYKEIDMPTMWLTLGFRGAKIDVEKWLALCEKNKEIAETMEKELGFNPRSSKQSKAALINDGLDVESTGDKAIGHLAGSNKLVKTLLDSRTYSKRVNTYGKNWIDTFVEADGRVYASWQVAEAITGRMSCRAPNLQNIPVRETPEYRECFIAGEGEKLVIADWSAQEPRIAAHLSKDQGLIDIFNSGDDIYIRIAKEMLGETITKKDPRRKDIKEIVIGACNGLTEYGLAKKIDKSPEEALELFNIYFETFPGLHEYREDIKRNRPEYVETINGRKIWLNNYVWGWERTGMDSPIQGSASDAMKLAMIRFCEKWGADPLDNPIILPVHDEIVLELPESMAKLGKQMLEETMIEVAEEIHPDIKAKVECSIGDSWAEKI